LVCWAGCAWRSGWQDFQGQKLSELLYQSILCVFGVAGFVAGFVFSSFSLMMAIFGVGCLFSILVRCQPPSHSSHSNDTGALQSAHAVLGGGLTARRFTLLRVSQVAVPNWPFYNRNPLEWLPVSARAADWAEAATTTKEPAATPSKKPRKPAKCAPVHSFARWSVLAATRCRRHLTRHVWFAGGPE